MVDLTWPDNRESLSAEWPSMDRMMMLGEAGVDVLQRHKAWRRKAISRLMLFLIPFGLV